MFIILSIIGYTLLSTVGFFFFEKSEFTENFFGNKQNSIYLSIAFIVFGIYLAQTEYITPPPNFIEQILYSLGNYLSCFIGATLATFIGMKGTFTFNNNKKFLHSLNSGIILGFLLLLSTSV